MGGRIQSRPEDGLPGSRGESVRGGWYLCDGLLCVFTGSECVGVGEEVAVWKDAEERADERALPLSKPAI